jgi:GcrA cell cycle regulator
MPSLLQTWTNDRVEALKSHFQAGLSCREIANEIGVSRNAVIGKISRLALVRDNGGDSRRVVRADAARDSSRPRPMPKLRRRILKAVQTEPSQTVVPLVEQTPVSVENGCSLFELTKERCRWPISTPGAEDFCFCGSMPVEGLPYCANHTRLAYRVASSR